MSDKKVLLPTPIQILELANRQKIRLQGDKGEYFRLRNYETRLVLEVHPGEHRYGFGRFADNFLLWLDILREGQRVQLPDSYLPIPRLSTEGGEVLFYGQVDHGSINFTFYPNPSYPDPEPYYLLDFVPVQDTLHYAPLPVLNLLNEVQIRAANGFRIMDPEGVEVEVVITQEKRRPPSYNKPETWTVMELVVRWQGELVKPPFAPYPNSIWRETGERSRRTDERQIHVSTSISRLRFEDIEADAWYRLTARTPPSRTLVTHGA